MVVHVLSLYSKSLVPNFSYSAYSQLDKQTINFAHLSNIVALKGGTIKAEQFLSADMADIFSNLYLAYSVKWFQENNKISCVLSEYCINKLVNENKILFNKIIDNSQLIHKPFIYHMKGIITHDNYKNNSTIINEIIGNKKIMETFKKDIIIIKDTVLEELEKLNHMCETTSDLTDYNKLYNKIIHVGEHKI